VIVTDSTNGSAYVPSAVARSKASMADSRVGYCFIELIDGS
jgi:hypothetical protein